MTKDEIVVGLDDSDPSRAALKWAADQARLSGSTLRAVYVSDWPTGVRADGRPVLVEDLVLVQDGELERAERAPITEIYREIAPEDDWSLEFARGKSGTVLVDLSNIPVCWWSAPVSAWVWAGSCWVPPVTTASATRHAQLWRFRLSMSAPAGEWRRGHPASGK